jgi:hypothetical protein
MNAPLRLGIAGLGTVGASVARLLAMHGDSFMGQLGRSVRVTAVSARDKSRPRDFDMNGIAWHGDPVGLARSNSIDVFVELIGGADGPAHASVRAALETGKGVVTANKASSPGTAALAKLAGAGLSFPSRRRSAAASDHQTLRRRRGSAPVATDPYGTRFILTPREEAPPMGFAAATQALGHADPS